MGEGVIHLTKLMISVPVIRPCPGSMFHPLVTMLALMAMISGGLHLKHEGRTMALV